MISEIHVIETLCDGVVIDMNHFYSFPSARDAMDRLENSGLEFRYRLFLPVPDATVKRAEEANPIDESLGVFTAVVSAGVVIAGIIATGCLF